MKNAYIALLFLLAACGNEEDNNTKEACLLEVGIWDCSWTIDTQDGSCTINRIGSGYAWSFFEHQDYDRSCLTWDINKKSTGKYGDTSTTTGYMTATNNNTTEGHEQIVAVDISGNTCTVSGPINCAPRP